MFDGKIARTKKNQTVWCADNLMRCGIVWSLSGIDVLCAWSKRSLRRNCNFLLCCMLCYPAGFL